MIPFYYQDLFYHPFPQNHDQLQDAISGASSPHPLLLGSPVHPNVRTILLSTLSDILVLYRPKRTKPLLLQPVPCILEGDKVTWDRNSAPRITLAYHRLPPYLQYPSNPISSTLLSVQAGFLHNHVFRCLFLLLFIQLGPLFLRMLFSLSPRLLVPYLCMVYAYYSPLLPYYSSIIDSPMGFTRLYKSGFHWMREDEDKLKSAILFVVGFATQGTVNPTNFMNSDEDWIEWKVGKYDYEDVGIEYGFSQCDLLPPCELGLHLSRRDVLARYC